MLLPPAAHPKRGEMSSDFKNAVSTVHSTHRCNELVISSAQQWAYIAQQASAVAAAHFTHYTTPSREAVKIILQQQKLPNSHVYTIEQKVC